ncbi:hypothetical protein CYMTET_20291 [Cymbomonas tetramitiformis]|uniref:Uncharacterized protein n=1 Tax=Cymbomonas tetramitiformis TaxID=36881 RepID=A0AAE0L4D0_9CHLO|nr:hypothetical protein CYMTET_20291 [Cymbomonas tetramitiformis]
MAGNSKRGSEFNLGTIKEANLDTTKDFPPLGKTVGPALSYLHDVVAECNETLDESEDGNLSYDDLHKRLHARGGNEALRAKLQFVENKVYQAADGVVADEVLHQWLNDFDKTRGKALLNSAAKNAANADARFGQDQRDQRWKDRKKHDEEKDKKSSAKGGKGRGGKPAADT